MLSAPPSPTVITEGGIVSKIAVFSFFFSSSGNVFRPFAFVILCSVTSDMRLLTGEIVVISRRL